MPLVVGSSPASLPGGLSSGGGARRVGVGAWVVSSAVSLKYRTDLARSTLLVVRRNSVVVLGDSIWSFRWRFAWLMKRTRVLRREADDSWISSQNLLCSNHQWEIDCGRLRFWVIVVYLGGGGELLSADSLCRWVRLVFVAIRRFRQIYFWGLSSPVYWSWLWRSNEVSRFELSCIMFVSLRFSEVDPRASALVRGVVGLVCSLGGSMVCFIHDI